MIHGGGWSGGSKERFSRFVDAPALLKAGISVAAITYRLMNHSQIVEPPISIKTEVLMKQKFVLDRIFNTP